MDKTFISMRTGEKYTGELPELVSHPYSERDGDTIVTKVDTAKKGDPGYEKVLVGYMFARGYIVEE
jgi:hypothetical protein